LGNACKLDGNQLRTQSEQIRPAKTKTNAHTRLPSFKTQQPKTKQKKPGPSCIFVKLIGCMKILVLKLSITIFWPHSERNKGCVRVWLCQKKYFKAKEEELWKLKYFTMQKL
jgi:hypothetical protein